MNRLIAAGAASYASLGIVSFLRPAMVPALFGGSAPTPDSRSEIRAVYGGLPLAIAGALVANPASAGTVGVITAGMAAGHAASVAVEQNRTTAVIPAFVAIEAVLAAVLLLGARQRSRS